MRSILALAALVIATSGVARAQRPSEITPEMTAMEARLLAKTGTQTRAWIKEEAARQRAGTAAPGEFDRESWRNSPNSLGSLSGGDIEALAFLVLMQAAKSANEDLKAVMSQVKSINAAKAPARETAAKTEALSLRLQTTTDRRTKSLETASKLMKKMAETESTIVQNLK